MKKQNIGPALLLCKQVPATCHSLFSDEQFREFTAINVFAPRVSKNKESIKSYQCVNSTSFLCPTITSGGRAREFFLHFLFLILPGNRGQTKDGNTPNQNREPENVFALCADFSRHNLVLQHTNKTQHTAMATPTTSPAQTKTDTMDEHHEEEEDERAVLNVGGVKFEVQTSTLTKYPNTVLGNLFLPKNKHLRKPDKRGEYFFDR